MKTLRIHLIRHGATDANKFGQYVGSRTDIPISPEGLKQLRELAETIEYPRIDTLYSSPMLRCRQTAAVLFPETEITVIDDLREYDFGEFEGKTAAELENNQYFLEWAAGKRTAPPGGEDNLDFTKRLCLGLNQIVHDMTERGSKSAGVIMHGGAIMMLLAACAVPRHKPVEWMADPGRGYTLLITPSLYHKSGIVEAIGII
ncbi:MAG: histidine phosphatase family protein [Acutalibacteraceae bacterium]